MIAFGVFILTRLRKPVIITRAFHDKVHRHCICVHEGPLIDLFTVSILASPVYPFHCLSGCRGSLPTSLLSSWKSVSSIPKSLSEVSPSRVIFNFPAAFRNGDINGIVFFIIGDGYTKFCTCRCSEQRRIRIAGSIGVIASFNRVRWLLPLPSPFLKLISILYNTSLLLEPLPLDCAPLEECFYHSILSFRQSGLVKAGTTGIMDQ